MAAPTSSILERPVYEVAEAAGFGPPIDSERFGPVPVDRLVGNAWFRYGPPGRIGRIDSPPLPR